MSTIELEIIMVRGGMKIKKCNIHSAYVILQPAIVMGVLLVQLCERL